MCGIFGYVGKGLTPGLLLDGIRRLEYRGYDSWGIALAGDHGIHVEKSGGAEGDIPHYVLTFERIAADDCKAFLPEGVDLVFDLEKDLGLSGRYTLSVANRVRPGKKPQ